MIPNIIVSESIETDDDIPQPIIKSSKGKTAQIVCFTLIVIMNLSSWIDLYGVFTELPLIIPLTPEGWTLPSVMSICVTVANIMPALVIFLRWYQGKRFSEIPYIYIIIIIGILASLIFALFWKETIYLFGRQRSIWIIGCVFALSMLDNTSSLVFFDYMKRFRSHYLSAAFLGEGLTGAIPTLLLLLQGIGGEAICVKTNNGTFDKPTFTEPRFSVTVFMFIITCIILASLIAFLILRWTNIISLADAAEPVKEQDNTGESVPMIVINDSIQLSTPTSTSMEQITEKSFFLLLFINTFNSLILFGILPPLVTYIVLPYGQKALYYSSFLGTLGYSLVLLLNVKRPYLSMHQTILGSICGCILASFLIIIAVQSPCPWWADTVHGAFITVFIHFISTMFIAYIRITIGNRIKDHWSNEKGLFYFGITIQLGSVIGTIPIFLLVNVFEVFVAREPCQTYCIK
ncbi:hypothetical protein I4U23_015878 [Adineta vaga]|nr:hypothetical protein I4U23_015878 [Adineta vaga]